MKPEEEKRGIDPRVLEMNEWFKRFHSKAGEAIGKFFGEANKNWDIQFGVFEREEFHSLSILVRQENRKPMVLTFRDLTDGWTTVEYGSSFEEIELGDKGFFEVGFNSLYHYDYKNNPDTLDIIGGKNWLTLYGQKGVVERVWLRPNEQRTRGSVD